MLENFIAIAYKSKFVFMSISASKKGFLLFPLAIVPVLIDKKIAILLLIAFMSFDFITGILVSYKEKKDAEKKDDSIKLESLITSEKLKRTGIKFFLYFSTIFLAYGIQEVFLIKTFKFGISDSHFGITLIIISWWILVEAYSILFENLKKLGIDILGIFKKIKGIKDEIK